MAPTQLPLLLCAGTTDLMVETTVAHLDERHAIWRILNMHGEPHEVLLALQRFQSYQARDLVEKQVLGRTRHSAILWYKYRPKAVRGGFSNTALAFGRLGRDIVITDAARAGELRIRILCRANKDIRGFLAQVREKAAPAFHMKLLYAGPPRGMEAPRLTPEDERLLAAALHQGYFDVPRRGSAREVGHALGRSASAVSAALRRASEKLVRSHLGLV